MKKTTKLLLVLAAVVAMTIGAVSTVMAAADVVIDSATWSEDDDGNYSAKDVNGTKISTGWAVDAAGRWYYFEDGIALQNEFLKWRGNTYYFGKDCIMCEGWVKFTTKNSDPIENLSPNVSGAINNILSLDDDTTTAYSKNVWCYFEKGGIAAMDKWVDVDGLWYYFDDVIMVCNDFDYVIDKKIYGFSGDGNMHVGWIPVTSTTKKGEGPTESSKTGLVGYVYYKSNGEMVDNGWEKINDNWYYFVKNTENSVFNKAGVEEGSTVMLSNIYIAVNSEKFWLKADGSMATGTVTLSKKYEYYKDVEAFLAGKKTKTSADYETVLKFNDNGSQVLGGKVDKVTDYYLAEGDKSIFVLTGDNYDKNSTELLYTTVCETKNADNVASTGTAISVTLAGDKVKDAFRIVDDKVYYYDKSGTMVKSDVVDFYGVTLAFDKYGVLIVAETDKDGNAAKKKVNGTYYYFDSEFGTVTIGTGANAIVANGCATKKPANAK